MVLVSDLKIHQENFERVSGLIHELEQFVFTSNSSLYSLEINQIITPDELTFLNDMYCWWETELESRFAQAILSDQISDSRKYTLYNRFHTLVSRELAMLDFQPEKIAFIGSGPFPITAILVQQELQQPVDCIDYCSEAVECSQTVIHKLGLQQEIRILHGHGQKIDLSQYDLIVVALLAKPKWSILRNIRKQARDKCLVLCRTSHDWRTLVYEPTLEKHKLGYVQRNLNGATGKQTISTLLLEPANIAQEKLSWQWVEHIDDELEQNIIELLNTVLQKETTIGFPGALSITEGRQLIAQVAKNISSRSSHLLIARDGVKVVAHSLLKTDPLPNCSHWGEVCRTIVHPSYRGADLITKMAQEIVKYSEQLGCELLKIDVRQNTRAAEAWKALGFVPYGALEDYARVSNRSYSGLFMFQKILDLRKRVFS